MGSFFGNWYQEAGLAIFTTLAPSGLMAILLLLPLLFIWGGGREGEGPRLCRYLILPLGVTLLGFVASTIQLGTPANALYVFTGVGRSPLSNEVLSVVIYFGLAGSYWIVSFGDRLKELPARIWLVAIGVSAIFALAMMGRAYSIWTIPTWSSVYVPVNLLLCGLVGGPVLAAGTLRAANLEAALPRGRALLVIGVLACLASVWFLYQQAFSLEGLVNSVTMATALVPNYRFLIAAYAVVCVVSFVFLAKSWGKHEVVSNTLFAIGSVAIFVAIFAMRCEFYAMYMTVGF